MRKGKREGKRREERRKKENIGRERGDKLYWEKRWRGKGKRGKRGEKLY